MYTYYICFWYYNAVKQHKVIARYKIVFDFNDYKIDIENARNVFINDLKQEMEKAQATKFYIHKSCILPEDIF